jgi:hypothetical protein
MMIKVLRDLPMAAWHSLRWGLEGRREEARIDADTRAWIAKERVLALQGARVWPEPFVLTDSDGDQVVVDSIDGGVVILSTEGALLTPDEADEFADAVKEHAAANRAQDGDHRA